VYELRKSTPDASFAVWPLARASTLVEWVRDGIVERLRLTLPNQRADIERVLIGRKASGADEGPTSLRVKIVPLPSIGHRHADHGIRRILVEVPAGCPVRADDVEWAFSGLELIDPKTGEDLGLILTPSDDESMLAHFGVANRYGSSMWRTITPVALPASARRRRIEPTRVAAEAKNGEERDSEQTRAVTAVAQALRHTEVRTGAEMIRVQREPFAANSARAESFATATRFSKERLWHVEVVFDSPIAGPLVIGDGRFLGLGVMAPVQRSRGIHAFVVEDGLAATPQPTEVARAVRRAVMARVQDVLGPRTSLPSFLYGSRARRFTRANGASALDVPVRP
jgi:CRISPR-associated protein Csb2